MHVPIIWCIKFYRLPTEFFKHSAFSEFNKGRLSIINTKCSLKGCVHSYHLVQVITSLFPFNYFISIISVKCKIKGAYISLFYTEYLNPSLYIFDLRFLHVLPHKPDYSDVMIRPKGP